jgi:hypothetical protein
MKAKILSLLFVPFLCVAAIQVTEECDATALKAELKKELKPNYKYDSSKTTRFYYKTKPQMKEIEIPLYMGEKYKFMFNTAGLTKDIEIGLYSKPTGHKKRKLLYKLERKEGQHIYSFEPSKSRKMYLSYSIPKVEEATLTKDCIIFVVGYQLKIEI